MNILWILPILIPLIGAVIIAILGRFVKEEKMGWNLAYSVIAILSLLGVLGVLIGFYNLIGSIPDDELLLIESPLVASTFKLDALT